MDSDNYEVVYCPEDDEDRVYCDICGNLFIERSYKNHLKSQTHTKNTQKRQQKSIQIKCDFFDKDMRDVSRNIHINSLKHKKRSREKYIINNPKFFEVDKILGDYVERNNKKFDLYLVNCEFKSELNKNTSFIGLKKYLLYWIEYFMSRG